MERQRESSLEGHRHGLCRSGLGHQTSSPRGETGRQWGCLPRMFAGVGGREGLI